MRSIQTLEISTFVIWISTLNSITALKCVSAALFWNLFVSLCKFMKSWISPKANQQVSSNMSVKCEIKDVFAHLTRLCINLFLLYMWREMLPWWENMADIFNITPFIFLKKVEYFWFLVHGLPESRKRKTRNKKGCEKTEAKRCKTNLREKWQEETKTWTHYREWPCYRTG